MSVTFARRRALRGASGGRSIGPAAASALASTDTVPALTTKVSTDPPTITSRRRRRRPPAPPGSRAMRGEDRLDDLAGVAADELADVGVEEQRDQEDAADDRHGEQQLERRLGDELRSDQRPVGGRDQRAALQGDLQTRGHAASNSYQFTFAVSCFTSASRSSAGTTVELARAVAAAGALAMAAGRLVAGVAFELWRFGLTDRGRRPRASSRDVAGGLRGDDRRAVARRGALSPATRPRRRASTAGDDGAARRCSICCATARRGRADERRRGHHHLRHRTASRGRGPGRAVGSCRRIASTAPPRCFVTPSPLGLRLVYIQPIVAATGAAGSGRSRPRASCSPTPAGASSRRSHFTLPTRSRPVSLRTALRGRGRRRQRTARSCCARRPGPPLAEASVARERHAARRAAPGARWSARWCSRPPHHAAAADRSAARPARRRARRRRDVRDAHGRRVAAAGGRRRLRSGCRSLSLGGAAAIDAGQPGSRRRGGGRRWSALWAAGVARLRLRYRRVRRPPAHGAATADVPRSSLQASSSALLLVLAERLFAVASCGRPPSICAISRCTRGTHPHARCFGGLLAVHLAALWAGALALAAAPARWRLPRRSWRAHSCCCALLDRPDRVAIAVLTARDSRVPSRSALLGVRGACAVAALARRRAGRPGTGTPPSPRESSRCSSPSCFPRCCSIR